MPKIFGGKKISSEPQTTMVENATFRHQSLRREFCLHSKEERSTKVSSKQIYF